MELALSSFVFLRAQLGLPACFLIGWLIGFFVVTSNKLSLSSICYLVLFASQSLLIRTFTYLCYMGANTSGGWWCCSVIRTISRPTLFLCVWLVVSAGRLTRFFMLIVMCGARDNYLISSEGTLFNCVYFDANFIWCCLCYLCCVAADRESVVSVVWLWDSKQVWSPHECKCWNVTIDGLACYAAIRHTLMLLWVWYIVG